MYTSVTLLSLVGFLASAAPNDSLWTEDYFAALEKGKKESKPLAVFVGSGPEGYAQSLQDGKVSDSIRKILADNFLCVYLDTTNPQSKKLIDVLAITSGKGIVVGDRACKVQALHIDGTVSEGVLSTQLQNLARNQGPVTTTVTLGTSRVSYYQADGKAPVVGGTTPPAGGTTPGVVVGGSSYCPTCNQVYRRR